MINTHHHEMHQIGSHPDSRGRFGTNANNVGDNDGERVGQCNKVEKGRQLCHNNEIEIPNSKELPDVLKVLDTFSRFVSEMKNEQHNAKTVLPSLKLLPLLFDNSYHHMIASTNNILAASVAVNSAVQSSLQPEEIVLHVIVDKKTYAVSPAIVEVKGVHHFGWLTRENVPVLEAVESHNGTWSYFHENHVAEANLGENCSKRLGINTRSQKVSIAHRG
ncbi:hypothetical protein PVL29_002411 [Vitis rotundifolia]|uniref:Uncharacterized protein n=1 Tax=Vitis rotundifolia TaxID=103349 RepID=A0AA39AH33_VITRO|nr:hypothetical protein PVL29_002411 [Vitis rotundifolia]